MKENVVTNHASGTFDVKLTPQAVEDGDAGLGIGRCLGYS
jgi:hypothetical protein